MYSRVMDVRSVYQRVMCSCYVVIPYPHRNEMVSFSVKKNSNLNNRTQTYKQPPIFSLSLIPPRASSCQLQRLGCSFRKLHRFTELFLKINSLLVSLPGCFTPLLFHLNLFLQLCGCCLLHVCGVMS